MQGSISGNIRKAFFWKNVRNFLRVVFLGRNIRNFFRGKFWGLRPKSEEFNFQIYQKSFLLRKYKKSFVLRKYKKSFSLRKYKKSFSLRKYNFFLILKLESFISGNKRNFIQERIFFSDFLFFVGWGWEKLHFLCSDGRWHGEGGMLKWWHYHWVFLKFSYFAHI